MADGLTLKQVRGGIKRKATMFAEYLNKLDKNNLSETDIVQIQIRCQKFEPVLDEFDQVQFDIFKLFPNDPAEEQEEVDFVKRYYNILAEAQSIVAGYNKNANPQNDQIKGNLPSQIIVSSSLPKLNIYKFSGKYEDWSGWKEAFIAVIDSDQGADNRQKFLYLRDSLEPHVLEVIKSIEIKPDNYKIAWDTLVQRFENKPLIIHNHIKSIVEYPQIQKESCKELRLFFDSLKSNLKSLEAMGENVGSWERLVLYICSKKLDPRTRRDWEVYKYEQDLPTMKDFHKFITQKCTMLERLEHYNENDNFETKKSNIVKKKGYSFVAREIKCEFCLGAHGIQNCNAFLMMSTPQRINKIKEKRLCLNCFSNTHLSTKCMAQKCAKCSKAHNLLLHLEFYNNKPGETAAYVSSEPSYPQQAMVGGVSPSGEGLVPENNTDQLAVEPTLPDDTITTAAVLKVDLSQSSSGINRNNNSITLLSTAIINIVINGKLVPAKALLDSGSTSNFICENFCKKYNIKMNQIDHTVNGIGKNTINLTKQTDITIQSTYDIFSTDISCLVIKNITDSLPRVYVSKKIFNIPDHCILADPTFNTPSEIDVLLGSQVFWSVLKAGQISLGEKMPILQNSKFGWILAGDMESANKQGVNNFLCCLSMDTKIDNQVAKFWEIEEISPKTRYLSDADKYCELNFEATTKRELDGRFNVTIPFKESLSRLGESREMALKRFYLLENKFKKNDGLRQDYISFMQEYVSLGHMSEIEQNKENLNIGYFLPHHAVIKTTSITTKCRVVFDASAKTDNGLGPSLNQVQFTGPALQNEIFSILVNFRQYKYVMCSDITKMYRQIWINENQRAFQKIFWRANPNEPIKLFLLNTVTYGYASAPYLAVRCILQLAKDFENKYPEASKIIASNFYVDDLITGHNSAEKLLEIQSQIYDILLSAGFELRKWLCNDPLLLQKFKFNDKTPASVLHIGENENNKTLGIFWNAANDTIQYSICAFNNNITDISKRKILSLICQIYDPLGLLSPIVVVAKLIMQELWRLKISWDEKVPEYIFAKWLKYQTDLKLINNIKIPRHACLSEYIYIELHGFADSSIKAYGACIYFRCLDITKTVISTKLLCSKTRVAPINSVSLPRLELSACVLLANLAKKVRETLEISFNNFFFWTDSSVTLAWLKGDISTYKTFVANRVSEICSLTSRSDWYHVKTDTNPADLASRGCTAKTLLESSLWFEGPDWLKLSEKEWPWSQINFELKFSDLNIPELKPVSISFVIINDFSEFLPIFDRYSNLNKLITVFGWVLRSLQILSIKRDSKKYLDVPDNLRPIKSSLSKVLQPQEFENSLLFLIKIVQIQCFKVEYQLLSENKPVQRESKLLNLNPFMYQSLIRVGGRLKNSALNFDKKHQIILPKNHKLTELIIKNEHIKLLHCGTQQLIYSIRETFWPISIRNSCKKIIKNCITCFRVNPKGVEYLMGDLPPERVQPSFPFENIGIDYGGPFLIRDRHVTRGIKLIKVYLCLIVCLATKACHLEAVTELTTAAFLLTLKRFIGRRGKPKNIFSDNGKNFVGANSELQALYQFLEKGSDQIEKSLVNERIKWHFIPARSATFGGLWEAAIKRAKYHLIRVIQGNTRSLTYEQFASLLVEIEGILNSRPLSPLSNDPLDLNPLTPAHFLIGRSLTALPQTSLLKIPTNRLNQFEALTSMMQTFWSRWSKEYLNQLQLRVKWRRHGENLKIGTLVILVEETTPPYVWRLGRVINIFPGNDGVVRVVELKTQSGVVKRAVNKVRPLPISES